MLKLMEHASYISIPGNKCRRNKIIRKYSFLTPKKTKIMASGPITSWEIDGETVETVSGFIFLGSKITADGDCSQEIKTLTPWKESYDQPR